MSIIKDYSKYLKEKRYSKSALETYPLSLKSFLDYLKRNNLDINNLTSQKLIDYKKYLQEKYSSKTVNVKLAAVKSFVEFLNKNKGFDITYSNLKAIKTSKKKDIKKVENINKLLSYIDRIEKDKKTKQRNKLIIKLLYYTGAKTIDIINIKPKDIQENTVLIGGKYISIIQDLLKEMKSYSSLLGAEPEDYIFCSFASTFNNQKKPPLTEKAVEDLFNRYKDVIDKNLTIRDLRNSFILDQKTNIPDIHSPVLWQEVNVDTDYLRMREI